MAVPKTNRGQRWFIQQPKVHLKAQYMVEHGNMSLLILEKDKLNIMFKCDHVCIVYRYRDGALAVLKNAIFNKRNPSVMWDCAKYAAYFTMTLMYAVALEDRDIDQFQFNKNDVILILADCKGSQFVGINTCNKLGVFPPTSVRVITKPRMYIGEGMLLQMSKHGVNTKDTYPIFKGKNSLFEWHTKDGSPISLQDLDEVNDPYNSPEIPLSPRARPFPPDPNNQRSLGPDEVPLSQRALPLPSDPNNQKALGPDEVYHVLQEFPASLNEYEVYHVIKEFPASLSAYETFPLLMRQAWFHGSISRMEAEKKLINEGDFLFRFKSDEPDSIAISCRNGRQCVHSVVLSNAFTIGDATVCDKLKRTVSVNKLMAEDGTWLKLLRTPSKHVYQDFKSVEEGGSSERESLSKIDKHADATNNSGESVYYAKPSAEQMIYKYVPAVINAMKKTDEYVKKKETKDYLYTYRDVMINDEICKTVAEFLEEEKWVAFARKLEIPLNVRLSIENGEYDIIQKTFKLLQRWLDTNKSAATVGMLVGILEKLDLEEITPMLQAVRKHIENKKDLTA